MRTVACIAALATVLAPQLAHAQYLPVAVAPRTHPVQGPPELRLASLRASSPIASWQGSDAGRDRASGAVYGFAIGAVVGGVGLAAANYAFTTSHPRTEYTLFSLLVGSAVGGAVGAIAGAIIGAPEGEKRDQATRQRIVRTSSGPGVSFP